MSVPSNSRRPVWWTPAIPGTTPRVSRWKLTDVVSAWEWLSEFERCHPDLSGSERLTKDTDRDITALCNAGHPWSPRFKSDAIYDIGHGIHEYWVHWTNSPETRIRVVNGRYGKYLRTDRDGTSKNNLDDLPDC